MTWLLLPITAVVQLLLVVGYARGLQREADRAELLAYPMAETHRRAAVATAQLTAHRRH